MTPSARDSDSADFERFIRSLLAALKIDGMARTELRRDTGLFSDIGLDSLQAFEMLVLIESAAGVIIAPPELPSIFTLGDAYDYFKLCKVEAASQWE